jgi:hypothetical protein
MSQALPKLSVPLPPLIPRLELDGPATALLQDAQDAAAGIVALAGASRFPEAVRLAAHALPKREAVWWACMCARAVPDPTVPENDMKALAAAEAWVRRPDEANRRAAMAAAQATKMQTAEVWAAVGAFWSGGSMAPEGQPVVPPGDHLTGVAISGAVVLAAVRRRPDLAEARFTRFLDSARDIAAGGAGRIAPEPGDT